LWPSLKLIHGRVRHLQSQGMVEKGNFLLEKKLGAWMEQNKSKSWTVGLNYIIFVMNSSICRATNKSPYEVVFGMNSHCESPWMDHLFRDNTSSMYEEDLAEFIQIDQDNGDIMQEDSINFNNSS
jgi:hypothetical protein